MTSEARGTDVILHLRAGRGRTAVRRRLREILRKYSDHITVPILMKKEQWDADGKAQVVTDEDEQVNQASALWARPKSEITEEQYQEFYKHVAHDFEPPLAYAHAKVEGRHEYTQLFFIPQRAPFDLWDREHRHGIKLYVRRVFIMDDAEELMPAYLRFVRGDHRLDRSAAQRLARDPAAVARTSQADPGRVGQARARRCSRTWPTNQPDEVRDVLEGVRPRPQGRHRRGRGEPRPDRQAAAVRVDHERRRRADRLARRLRRPDEGRAGRDLLHHRRQLSAAARNSPHLEVFRKLGVEVLLMYDRIDEWVVSQPAPSSRASRCSRWQAAISTSSKLGTRPRSRPQTQQAGEYKDLLDRIQEVLADRASAVRRPQRLTDSPACLVGDEHGMSMNLERHPQSRGPAGAGGEADPRNQPGSPDRQAADAARADESAIRGVESDPVRPGDAGGGRAARRSGRVRQAAQRSDAGAGGRGPSRIWTP